MMVPANTPGGAPDSKRDIHPLATFGEQCLVWAFASVLSAVRVGKNVSIGARAEIGRGSTIGDRTRISAGVFLPPNSVIGPDVFIGPGCVFTDDRYPRTLTPGEHYHAEPPTVCAGASIGAGSVVLPGVTIGANARVAAGSVVSRDVPDSGKVLGSPAREYVPKVAW